MSQRLDAGLNESYRRRVLFGIELFDAVTLSRVSQGVEVVADGLLGKPVVNSSGSFVWLQEDIGPLQKITIAPGPLPYENFEYPGSKVKELVTTEPKPPMIPIELQPRVDYAFAPGITGLRGTLIEKRIDSPIPVGNAAVRLEWLDDDQKWHTAPTRSKTHNKRGDFVSILRLAPTEVPFLQEGELTVRLRASRNGGTERRSDNLKLSQGRVTDPSASNTLTFAWDEFQS